jgi:hypothetical protein
MASFNGDWNELTEAQSARKFQKFASIQKNKPGLFKRIMESSKWFKPQPSKVLTERPL